jgi:hypothetical protein
MDNKTTNWQYLRNLPKALPTSITSESKWGVTSVLASLCLFLFPLSLSFWAIWISLDGGKIMPPSSIPSLVFAILAALSFLSWIGITIYMIRVIFPWYKKSSSVDKADKRLEHIDQSLVNMEIRLVNIETGINSLTNEIRNLLLEIRRDRNERNNDKPK